jgi:hypothetical protein
LVSRRFVEGRHPICGCVQEAQLVKACDQPRKCAAIDAAHFSSDKPVSAIQNNAGISSIAAVICRQVRHSLSVGE